MARFDSLYSHGFIRAAACAPQVTPADPLANAAAAIELMREADAGKVALLVLPELGLSAYAIDDLHMQAALLAEVRAALREIAAASAGLLPLTLVGAPIQVDDALYNCAVAVHRGRILGVVPKTFLPNYREYYEKRQFASARDALVDAVDLGDGPVPFGQGLVFRAADAPLFRLGVEVCEDLWAPAPPSTRLALAGATLIANLSASNVVIGKADERRLLCASHSARAMCAHVYAAAGIGESTTDLAWDGQLMAHELGELVAESGRFAEGANRLFADLDLERVSLARLRTPTFRDAASAEGAALARVREVPFELAPPAGPVPLARSVRRFPFVPDDPARLDQDCYEACNIQIRGLRQRLEATSIPRVVIGVSGGLDSTQALLVAARAFDEMGRSRRDIIGVTLPGFATSAATRDNAWRLMQEIGVDAREVDIRPLARQMLADLGHPFARGEPVHDVTFENVQAGLRTDYLFRLANHERALVVGTGDLSELALGWSTYGVGDHMSHYNVNAGAPKTLIQHLIRWTAATGDFAGAAATLRAILATPISPELAPAGPDGAIQSTEAAIGPYALHDFFLHHTVRHGFAPAKIAFLAEAAWGDAARGSWPPHLADADKRAYALGEIVDWLEVFARRFFATSQFKRSASPNGPKITSGGALSPRGDWRVPSDAGAAPWLRDVARLRAQLADEGGRRSPASPPRGRR